MKRIFFHVVALTIATGTLSLSSCSLQANVNDEQEKIVNAKQFLTWLKNNRDEDTGLPYSHVGDVRFKNWTITYDAAVVALAYCAEGEYDDAGKILDYYIEHPQVWRLGGVIEAFIVGDPIVGKDWSIRSGANIWMGIAAVTLYSKTGELKYLEFAERIATLILSLQNKNKDDPNFGGVALGPKGDPNHTYDQYIGYDPDKPEFYNVYATEVTIDAYALFRKLYKVTQESKYKSAASLCFDWLKSVAWNKQEHRFNRGYKDPVVATDVQSWAISALGVEGLNSIEDNAAEKIISFVEKNCLVNTAYSFKGREVSVRGVDFTDKHQSDIVGRPRMVSFEWTFQLVNAYNRLSNDFMKLGEAGKAEIYYHKREKLLKQLLHAAVPDDGGLAYPYATLSNAPIGHEYRTPSTGNLSVIGDAWAILAIEEFDPLILNGSN